jgi:hypothetical protein
MNYPASSGRGINKKYICSPPFAAGNLPKEIKKYNV